MERCSVYLLKFKHIHVAMKRHYYGLNHGILLEAFTHSESHPQQKSAYQVTALLSYETRIDNDEIPMRLELAELSIQYYGGRFAQETGSSETVTLY